MTSLIVQETDISENVLSKVKKIHEVENETGEKYRQLTMLGKNSENINDKIYSIEEAIKLVPEALDAYYIMMVYELFIGGNFNRGYSYGTRVSPERNSRPLLMGNSLELRDYLFDVNLAVLASACGFHEEAYYINERPIRRGITVPILFQHRESFLTKASDIGISINQMDDDDEEIDDFVSGKFNTEQTEIVIDNFYKNPDKVANFATSRQFDYTNQTQSFATEYHKKVFEKLLSKNITHWPEDEGTSNGAFRKCARGNSTIELEDSEWMAIVFLSRNVSCSGGLITYKHRETGLHYAKSKRDKNAMISELDNKKSWDVVDKIGNKFNRCIVLKANQFHDCNKILDKNSGEQIIQTFFFDA